MAATAVYSGYLIVSHATQNSVSKRWSVIVDISSQGASQPNKTIFASDRFDNAFSEGFIVCNPLLQRHKRRKWPIPQVAKISK